MVDRDTCKTHLARLSSLPFFNAVTPPAFTEWVTVMAKNADDPQHAIRAVTTLLAARQLPQAPEDVLDAVNATRIHERPAESFQGACCGRTVDGWTYMSHHPTTPVTRAEENLEADPPRFLFPSRCINGWIQRTIWKPVVPARIDEEGNPIRQPYDFGGRCKCQPGGWV